MSIISAMVNVLALILFIYIFDQTRFGKTVLRTSAHKYPLASR